MAGHPTLNSTFLFPWVKGEKVIFMTKNNFYSDIIIKFNIFHTMSKISNLKGLIRSRQIILCVSSVSKKQKCSFRK